MMRSDTTRGTFEEVIAATSPELAELARRLRAMFEELLPDGLEVPRPGERHVDYGLGPSTAKEICAYICPMERYVRLGFYYGGALPDPAGLLRGEGKRLRHIKLATLEEAARPELRQLLEAAVQERRSTLGL